MFGSKRELADIEVERHGTDSTEMILTGRLRLVN